MSDPNLPPPPTITPFRSPQLELRALLLPLTNDLYNAIKYCKCSGSQKDRSLFTPPLLCLSQIIQQYNYPGPNGGANSIKVYLLSLRDKVKDVVEDRSEGGLEWLLGELGRWLGVLSGENR